MSSTFIIPSHFSSSFLTTIPDTRYDSKGRQMSFSETEVQRLERMAFASASKSRSNSPTSSPSHSGASSPSRMKLISEPYGDPIELMANRLAEELIYGSIDDFSSSDEEQQVIYSTPRRNQRVPPIKRAPAACKVPSTTFTPGHRRNRSSLSAIPEED